MGDSQLEKLYNQYLTRNDTEIYINEKRYIRLLHSEFIQISGKDFLIAYISSKLDCKIGDIIQDENGSKFVLETPIYMRFSGDIPKWYLNTTPWSLKWGNTNEIGNYITLA